MFTGLIRCIGTLKSLRDNGESRILTISHDFGFSPEQGASIAVQGVCITVLPGSTSGIFQGECFFATLRKTNLLRLSPGCQVHLEPALTLGDALDGHLVQGHVKQTIRVLENRKAGRGRALLLEKPSDSASLLKEEDAVALDGVSLTIAASNRSSFTIQLIGETLEKTLLAALRPGMNVNLETDFMIRGTMGTAEIKQRITPRLLGQWGYV